MERITGHDIVTIAIDPSLEFLSKSELFQYLSTIFLHFPINYYISVCLYVCYVCLICIYVTFGQDSFD